MSEERRENFFMVDNDIFSFGLKPRDIVVYCYLCRRMNRRQVLLFHQDEISQRTVGSAKRKP